jgi:hypothetical protein
MNNTVQNEVIATNGMVFTRTTMASFLNANNIDYNALRVGGHGFQWLSVHFAVRKK